MKQPRTERRLATVSSIAALLSTIGCAPTPDDLVLEAQQLALDSASPHDTLTEAPELALLDPANTSAQQQAPWFATPWPIIPIDPCASTIDAIESVEVMPDLTVRVQPAKASKADLDTFKTLHIVATFDGETIGFDFAPKASAWPDPGFDFQAPTDGPEEIIERLWWLREADTLSFTPAVSCSTFKPVEIPQNTGASPCPVPQPDKLHADLNVAYLCKPPVVRSCGSHTHAH